MPFKFAWLVELLQNLDDARRQKAVSSLRKTNPDQQIVTQWFRRYDSRIARTGSSATAFLSCLFPEHVPRRSYAVREKKLSAIFGRALGLGVSRARALHAWQESNGRDFASCVEAVMAECENDLPSPGREVTLEEMNLALLRLAANSASSAPDVQETKNGQSMDQLLAPILRRLQSHEAKWLIRMIFKSYAPVEIPERAALSHFHFLLPDILAVQDSLEAAVDTLSSGRIIQLPPAPKKEYVSAFREAASHDLRPQLGIMIKRQPYDKARSIRHCCKMADKRVMSVERKYDGEYCQIHIDRSCGTDLIQIFSKSGKDSTQDRVRLHNAIKDALALDREGCKIRQRCVLEGELMIWNALKKDFEPFHKIREHVMHGGRPLGRTSGASPPRSERVMIMFYDILLLDDRFIALEPHSQRRQILKGLVKCISGSSSICERVLIDFSSSNSPKQLRSAFAQCIKKGWEGFVLKGNNDPYVSFKQTNRCIKLKKDYITALGETADLCLIGASRNSNIAMELSLGEGIWTDFHIATLENRDAVRRFEEKPSYKVIDTINPKGMSKDDLLALNARIRFLEMPFAQISTEMTVQIASKAIPESRILFKMPIIVEVMGAGFDKNSGCNHYVLRFPRITKLHFDRGLEDVISFQKLQEIAEATVAAGSDGDTKGDADWIERLRKADGQGVYVTDKTQSTSPGKTPRSLTTISLSPVSSRKPKLPPLVRVDSAEMTVQELLDRQRSSQTPTTASMATPQTLPSTTSKRRLQIMDTMLTTNATRKRWKTSRPESSPLVCKARSPPVPSRTVLEADEFPMSSLAVRPETLSSRKASGLVKTPRWCHRHRSTSPSTRQFDSSAGIRSLSTSHQQTKSKAEPSLRPGGQSKDARQPLAEMTNVSPQLSRRTLPHPPRTQSSPDPKPQKHHHEQDKQSVTIENAQINAPPIFPFLPTPPTSSEESAGAERVSKRKEVVMQSEPHDTLPPISRRDWKQDPHQQISRHLNPSSWNWPLYISPSLAMSPKPKLQDLMILICRTDATYTFSRSTFMAQIFKQPFPGQVWVVLVDGEACCFDRDLFSVSPASPSVKSPFPVSDFPIPDAATVSVDTALASSSLNSNLPSSLSAPRPSTASTILSIGQDLAHLLSSSSYTDTTGDVIPPVQMQAVDIVFFDYHILAINASTEQKADANLSTVGRGDVPTTFPLDLYHRPSFSVPGPYVFAQPVGQDGDLDLIGDGADDPWQEMFVACLRYTNAVRDVRGKRAIKVIWDWDEMMGGENKRRDKGKARADTEADNDNNMIGAQAFDTDPLGEQYEKMSRRRGPTENQDVDTRKAPDHPYDVPATARPSPTSTEERGLARQFWHRIRQRDEDFQRTLDLEKSRQASVPAYETWDMLKRRSMMQGYEKRKRNRETKGQSDRATEQSGTG